MCVYRSFVDMFIFVLVHYHFGLPIPFMVGSKEDTPPTALLKLLHSCGYIELPRLINSDRQSQFINKTFI